MTRQVSIHGFGEWRRCFCAALHYCSTAGRQAFVLHGTAAGAVFFKWLHQSIQYVSCLFSLIKSINKTFVNRVPAMRGVGIGQVIATCFVTTYYASLMGLTIRYFLASFSDPLPWSECKTDWNSSCIDSQLKSMNGSDMKVSTSAELYFV